MLIMASQAMNIDQSRIDKTQNQTPHIQLEGANDYFRSNFRPYIPQITLHTTLLLADSPSHIVFTIIFGEAAESMIHFDPTIPECSQEESLDEMLSPCPSLQAGGEASLEKMQVPSCLCQIYPQKCAVIAFNLK